LFSILYIII
jgi:hypothetical protein